MTFQEKCNAGQFVLTSEVGPPKGMCLDKVVEEVLPLKNRIDALNVTDLQSSVMRMSSLAASVKLKDAGFETILQLTCRDRNRLALQSEVLSAAAFGITNVLVLTGDHPSLGDHPEAKPVFDLDSVMLVQALKTLESGQDMNGNKLCGEPPKFFVGAAVNPGADPLEAEMIKMEKKIEAGAGFFQTQAVFDLKVYEEFLNRTSHLKVPVLAGIMFLKSERMARYVNEHVPGVFVPEELIQEMARAADKKQKCLEIAVRTFQALRSRVQGIHIMPIGWYNLLPAFLDAVDWKK